MSKQDITNRIDIALDTAEVVRAEFRFLIQQVDNPSRAVRLSPRMREEKRIVGADDSLVCSDDNSRWRIVELGKFVHGNEINPIACVC